jgi:acetyltransferase-like isoleucine patch superfamily enzyme
MISNNRRPWVARVRTSVRPNVNALLRFYYVHIWGMDIGPGCRISLDARLDKTNPRGIHIGRDTAINFGVAILTHDYIRRLHVDTWVGERCQVGARSIIMPGVRIGDGCVIAAGSVVMKDVPPGCLVYGNPARVMEKGLVTGALGVVLERASKVPPEPEKL